eukprot:UN21033
MPDSKSVQNWCFFAYLRVTTFWDLKIYTQKYMTPRDFDNFLFFLEFSGFFVPHYTRQFFKKVMQKRNDHVFT